MKNVLSGGVTPYRVTPPDGKVENKSSRLYKFVRRQGISPPQMAASQLAFTTPNVSASAEPVEFVFVLSKRFVFSDGAEDEWLLLFQDLVGVVSCWFTLHFAEHKLLSYFRKCFLTLENI